MVAAGQAIYSRYPQQHFSAPPGGSQSFPGQMRYIIPPARSRSTPGSPPRMGLEKQKGGTQDSS